MSREKERDLFGGILMREFGEYATALTEAGHDWTVWETAVWPPDSRLNWLHGRFLLARECAGVSELRPTDGEISQEYRARLAYLEMFPDGIPSLADG
ncbi:hypothetical protein KUF83_30200 [Streptomyces sp. BV286]|uniref:hypothetical protein n=1 Tax=Streptomyces sp. BV286 TaxID=2849672 RepID=UPI001C2EAF9E|nr:hypothetical protein [Streptomyces sp. BV286]MBV1940809.1 hypothetical protein [Streptomyces sp. BV286]